MDSDNKSNDNHHLLLLEDKALQFNGQAYQYQAIVHNAEFLIIFVILFLIKKNYHHSHFEIKASGENDGVSVILLAIHSPHTLFGQNVDNMQR